MTARSASVEWSSRSAGAELVLGTIAGAVAAWLWARDIGDYVEGKARGVRTRAAEGLRAVEETTGQVLDRSGSSLRRAEELLQGAREHVSEALRVGEHAIRPAPTTGGE